MSIVERVHLLKPSRNSFISPTTVFIPPPCQLPFLPRTPETLKIGNLAKVILKSGRIAVGRIRYVGCVKEDTIQTNKEEDVYIGVQLPSEWGDSDGAYEGKRFFDW